MDAISLVMFAFTFILGFIFFIFGFGELREIFRAKEKGMAAPAMGTIYFFICTIFWLVLGMYWPAMATDAALGTLGWVWIGFALISASLAIACIGFILHASIQKPQESKLEIQEERKQEGY
jgi:signal transduction histidine kinase